jgi:hypothetical protein
MPSEDVLLSIGLVIRHCMVAAVGRAWLHVGGDTVASRTPAARATSRIPRLAIVAKRGVTHAVTC